jgi:hypothetical protein
LRGKMAQLCRIRGSPAISEIGREWTCRWSSRFPAPPRGSNRRQTGDRHRCFHALTLARNSLRMSWAFGPAAPQVPDSALRSHPIRLFEQSGAGRDQDSVACSSLFQWRGCGGSDQRRNFRASSDRGGFPEANNRRRDFFSGYLDQGGQAGNCIRSRPGSRRTNYAGYARFRQIATATSSPNGDAEDRKPASSRQETGSRTT